MKNKNKNINFLLRDRVRAPCSMHDGVVYTNTLYACCWLTDAGGQTKLQVAIVFVVELTTPNFFVLSIPSYPTYYVSISRYLFIKIHTTKQEVSTSIGSVRWGKRMAKGARQLSNAMHFIRFNNICCFELVHNSYPSHSQSRISSQANTEISWYCHFHTHPLTNAVGNTQHPTPKKFSIVFRSIFPRLCWAHLRQITQLDVLSTDCLDMWRVPKLQRGGLHWNARYSRFFSFGCCSQPFAHFHLNRV